MGIEIGNGYCPNCRTRRRLERSEINHVLHLVLTFLLCGLWVFVWLMIMLTRGPWRCSECGTPAGFGRASVVLSRLIWASAFVVLLLLGIGFVFSPTRPKAPVRPPNLNEIPIQPEFPVNEIAEQPVVPDPNGQDETNLPDLEDRDAQSVDDRPRMNEDTTGDSGAVPSENPNARPIKRPTVEDEQRAQRQLDLANKLLDAGAPSQAAFETVIRKYPGTKAAMEAETILMRMSK